jgi:hypothetical protein
MAHREGQQLSRHPMRKFKGDQSVIIVLGLASFLAITGSAISQYDANEDNLKVGFAHKEFLYTVQEIKRPSQIVLHAHPIPSLTKQKWSSEEQRLKYSIDPFLVGFLDEGQQYRFRIGQGYFWGTQDIVKFGDNTLNRIHLDELILCDTKISEGRPNPLFKKKHPKDTNFYFVGVKETVYDDYAERYPERVKHPLYTRGEGKNDPRHKIGEICFDFLPTSPTTFLVFVLRKERIHVWVNTAVPGMGDYTEFDLKSEEDKVEAISVDFNEPFHVFGKDRTYYFVTQSGKLYCSPKPAAKGKRRAEALWTDAGSPIRAVICDTASDRTFVFTEPAKKGGERVYIDLAEKVQTTPYERKPFEGVKLDQSLKTMMEYAQVLVKDKRIK